MTILPILALCAAVVAHPSEPPIVQRVQAQAMQPAPVLEYSPGPASQPAAELRAWLSEQEARDPKPMLRLPVVLSFAADTLPSIERAWIGVLPQAPEGAVLLRLDDSALGVSLLDRARELCAPGATTCALWLDGTPGSLLPLLLPAVPGAPPVFAVRGVHGLIAPGDEIRAYVQQ